MESREGGEGGEDGEGGVGVVVILLRAVPSSKKLGGQIVAYGAKKKRERSASCSISFALPFLLSQLHVKRCACSENFIFWGGGGGS